MPAQEAFMTGLAALWLPILVSSVLVFVVSPAIHMASPWHKSDYPKLPNEGRVLDALRPLAIPAGDYMMPRASSRQEMRSPEFAEKMKKGSGHDAHRVAGRLHVDGDATRPVVPLCHCGRVRRRACARSRRRVRARVPLRRRHSVRRLRGRTVADVDLVPPRLVYDDQGVRGRSDLRAPDGGRLRLAVATIEGRVSAGRRLARRDIRGPAVSCSR